MKIAIILTGDVRECDVKHDIKKIFEGFDIYCGSYITHKQYISDLCGDNHCLIDPNTDIKPPVGVKLHNMQQNMLQWLHLDNVLKKFGSKLSEYDILLRYRFDYRVNCDFMNRISTVPGTLYHDGDKMFYASTETFMKLFCNYYDNLTKYTYVNDRSDDDDSFETSWRSEPALDMHVENSGHTNSPLPFPHGKIVRGTYPKVRADGNKKLYKNNVLLGKFQNA